MQIWISRSNAQNNNEAVQKSIGFKVWER